MRHNISYRSRDEIYASILSTIQDYEKRNDEALKIKVIYGARLSSEQLQRRIDEVPYHISLF